MNKADLNAIAEFWKQFSHLTEFSDFSSILMIDILTGILHFGHIM